MNIRTAFPAIMSLFSGFNYINYGLFKSILLSLSFLKVDTTVKLEANNEDVFEILD